MEFALFGKLTSGLKNIIWHVKNFSYLLIRFQQNINDTWVILKVMRFNKIFVLPTIQFLIKFWLMTFATMEILNLQVGTVPRKFDKYLWSTNRLAHFYP